MAYLPLPYIQLESTRTNGADYFDTQWSAGYGFSVQFAGGTFTNAGYLFGAMTSEDSDDKFAMQFQDGKYILYYRNKTAESPENYELGELHYFNFYSDDGKSCTWSIDGVSMPTLNFDSGLMQNPINIPVYVGAVNVGGEAQHLSDVQIGYISFSGSSGSRQWNQCKTQDGQFGFYLYSGAKPTFVEKPDFSYGGVMALQSGTMLTVVGIPTKTEYKLGEPFDPTGMTVYLNLDDGTQRDVTDEATLNPPSEQLFRTDKIIQHGFSSYVFYIYNPVGVKYSNFQFGGGRIFSVSLPSNFNYTVSADYPVESIEVTKLPDKTEYLIKEYFSTTGMVVTGHLENGDTAELGDSTGYSGVTYLLSKAGTFSVTINWYDGSKYLYADPFQITVKNAVEKLNVTLPAKTEYSIGEKFNPTGITVTALYLDGTERPIYNFFVDSSKFDSTKEGGYAITVKATVDEKEYTETITVYVFGEPKRLLDLLNTTDGMTVIRNNVKNDGGKDTISGVDWFVFDGNKASKIYVSGDNFISFNNTTEHIKICRRDGATYYVYSQAGKLDNGHRFFKIRVEGYTYWSSTASSYALKYELFLFDDNSMFLNIMQAPTNTYYLGTSELLYGTTHTTFTVEPGKAQVFSFYTTDAVQGKPWTVEQNYHKFFAEYILKITAKPKKREYRIGDSFDEHSFTVSAVHYYEGEEPVSNFTATSETFDGNKEGRYPVTVTAQIDGQDFTAETLVAVYGEAHDILDLLNTKDGMQAIPEAGYNDVNYFGDVSWFVFDGKDLEKIGLYSRQHVYFNEKEAFTVCSVAQTTNRTLVQEGMLQNGHKFFKMKVEPISDSFADYELFLFDNNSMYLNIISSPKSESSPLDCKLVWSDGEIKIPVVFGEPMVASFYTNNPAEGKPWTADYNEHAFIAGLSLKSLLDTIDGMEELPDGTKDVDGVPWFIYDGSVCENIQVDEDLYFDFKYRSDQSWSYRCVLICSPWNSNSEIEKIYREEGLLDTGNKFLKLRVEAVKNYSYPTRKLPIKFEFFLFDDGGMFLNLTQAPEEDYAIGECGLIWIGGNLPITIEANEPKKVSFYTSDPSQGKPWICSYYDYDFSKTSVQYLTAIPTKREYNAGEEFDSHAFDVTATYLNGDIENIDDFTVDYSNFKNNKEGRYVVTVKATIDGAEYTAKTIVVVYEKKYSIYDLLSKETGMSGQMLYHVGINHAHIYGAQWFIYDGKPVYDIEVNERGVLFFTDSTSENFVIRPFTHEMERKYFTQEGMLSNGHRFFKIRGDATNEQTDTLYELFFFDDNSIYLNAIKTGTLEYDAKSFLKWSDGNIDIPIKKDPFNASFYTSDPSQGKPWEMETGYHKFIKTVDSISLTTTKREYALYEKIDLTTFSVSGLSSDGTTIEIDNFTLDSSKFDNTKEGIYTIKAKKTILGTEYSAETVVVVYGEPHNILDLLNTDSGMAELEISFGNTTKTIGNVPWFVFDEKPIEKVTWYYPSIIYFNEKEAVCVCRDWGSYGSDDKCYVQEGMLDNGHRFYKMRRIGGRAFTPNYELFLFDDESMYLFVIPPTRNESYIYESKIIWSDGFVDIPVKFGENFIGSFYTDNPNEGKPWTMEVDYHNFIKEKMWTLTVNGGSGSGLYLPGELVKIKAEEKTGSRLRWLKDGELFVPEIKVKQSFTGSWFSALTFTKGDLVIFAQATTNQAEEKSGWNYIGTLNDKGTDDGGEYNYFLHLYATKYSGNEADIYGAFFIEFASAESIEIQESTRQESVSMSSGNSFLCHRDMEGFFVWFMNSYYFSDDRRWIATPDIVEHIPDPKETGRQSQAVFIDNNTPPQDFRVSVSPAISRPASIFGAIVNPAFTGYEYEMTFTMPDKDLTVTAEYSPKISRIEITQKPFDLNYDLGEDFDESGMVVTAFFADGTSAPVTDYTVSGFDSETSGAKTVTITYTDGFDSVTAELTVNVGTAGIMVTKFPEKKSYAVGDIFVPDGLEVSFVYEDKSTYPTEDYTLSGFDSDSVGIKTITVTCEVEGRVYTAQFSVFVTADGGNAFSGYNENRDLRIHFLNGKYKDITGDEIESESMSLIESIGNDKNLQFGGCVSTQFTVNIFSEQFLDPDTCPEGDIEAYLVAGEQELKIFTGTIESARRTGGLNKRKLIAYDYLKTKGTIKLKNWYQSLQFPITQKAFRDSLFEFIGIEQIPVSLEYDNAYVPDNMNVDSLTFLSLVKDICLCNMCFGHINADGKFEYIFLRPNGGKDPEYHEDVIYYDPEDVIPDDAVITSEFKEGKVWYPSWFWVTPDPRAEGLNYKEPSEYSAYQGNIYFVRNSYMTGDIDWIKKAYRNVVVGEADDGIVFEETQLQYPIIYGPHMSLEDMSRLYLAREYSLTTPGNFLRRIGTNIAFNSIKYLDDGTPVTWTINSYIMSRTITGIRSLRDVYTAKNSAYNEEAYGAAKEIRDNSDALSAVKGTIPKSTVPGEDGNPSQETFNGVDSSSKEPWSAYFDEEYERIKNKYAEQKKEEEMRKMAEDEAERKAKEREAPNTFYIYKDGVTRYNGTTISGGSSSGGGGTGGFNVLSVTELPESPDQNTIYLIQGEVVVE